MVVMCIIIFVFMKEKFEEVVKKVFLLFLVGDLLNKDNVIGLFVVEK